jgi:hypothetical protein
MYKIEQLLESFRGIVCSIWEPGNSAHGLVSDTPDIRTLTSTPRHCPQKCVFQAGLMVRPFFVRER